MVTVQGYAPPAQAEFFESTGLLFSSGQEQTRRFIHEAEDFVVFSPNSYKQGTIRHMATQEQFCEHCGAANVMTARFCQNCATPLPFNHLTGDLPEQTMLSNRYELVMRIGQGGMGAVYKAIDTRFNNRT